MNTPSTEPDHWASIETAPSGLHRSVCTYCGWVGEWSAGSSVATEEGRSHTTIMSKHRIDVDHGDDQFRARCACGWMSAWTSSGEATYAAAGQHLVAATT